MHVVFWVKVHNCRCLSVCMCSWIIGIKLLARYSRTMLLFDEEFQALDDHLEQIDYTISLCDSLRVVFFCISNNYVTQ